MAASIEHHLETITITISGWPGITRQPHRFGGQEFRLGNVEVGHMHRNGMVDIPFTKAIRALLVEEGRALPHHLLHESGWITFFVRDAATMQDALWLFELSALQKQLARSRNDITRRLALVQQLEHLHLSDGLRAALKI